MIQPRKTKEAKIKKNIADYGYPEYYKQFKEDNPESNIDKKTFIAINKEYWNEVLNLMIYQNYEVKFPVKMGYLKIVKFKRKPYIKDGKVVNLKVDYGATNKLWKIDPEAKNKKVLKYINNEHTDNYEFTFWWDRRTSIVKNISFYSFKVNRTSARELARALKDDSNNIDFYEHPKPPIRF